MVSARADVDGGISVQRAFRWTPELIGLTIGWLGLWSLWYGIAHPWKADANSAVATSPILISIALVFLGFRFVQRRYPSWSLTGLPAPLRVVAFPERNYVEIFSTDKSREQVPFSSLAILRYSAYNSFIEVLLSGGVTLCMFVWMIVALRDSRLYGSGFIFISLLLGTVLLSGAWLASVLRTRLFHRVLLLPTGRMLITTQEAEKLGFRVDFTL
jgi:hypothetical protein